MRRLIQEAHAPLGAQPKYQPQKSCSLNFSVPSITYAASTGVTATPAETVKFFEEHFSANVGKCLNTMAEIRNRKIDQSKSFHQLRVNLKSYLDSADSSAGQYSVTDPRPADFTVTAVSKGSILFLYLLNFKRYHCAFCLLNTGSMHRNTLPCPFEYTVLHYLNPRFRGAKKIPRQGPPMDLRYFWKKNF